MATVESGLEMNGLPRVAWTFQAWRQPPKGRHFRLVLVNACAHDDRHLVCWDDASASAPGWCSR